MRQGKKSETRIRGHGWNTNGTRNGIRAESVFHPWLMFFGLLLVMGAAARTDEPTSKPPAQKSADSGQEQGAEPKPSAERPLESFKLPAGAIFVIGKQLSDAIGFSPEMFVLKKKDYDALMERIEQLERLLQPGKPQAPSVCKISGEVKGERVHFRIRYEFTTTRAPTLIALGGQPAWPVAATLDEGELPLLLSEGSPGAPAGEDGLWVRVEKSGSHALTLDLEALPETKGDDRTLTLDLPRAAITILDEFIVPASVPEVRIEERRADRGTGRGIGSALLPGFSAARLDRWIKTVPQDGEHRRLSAVPLGAAQRLGLMWKGPVANADGAEPLLTAEGRRWDVRVDENSVLTEVTLILQARRGRTNRWQIQLPTGAQVEVKEPSDAEERIQKISFQEPTSKNQEPNINKPVADTSVSGGSLTIELKQASADPLRVVLQVRQNWTEGRVAIGPYLVRGAFRQWGIIRVTEPPDLRVRYHLRADVNRRQTPSEAPGDSFLAEFAYWNLQSSTASPAGSVPDGSSSPVPLILEAVKGPVETRVEHELRWTDPAKGGTGPGWQITSKIQVTPNRTSLDKLELRIPADYGYDKDVGATSNNAVIDEVVIDSGKQTAQIRLQKQSRPFTINLPAFYPVAEGAQQAALELPRPVQALDRGGQITATLPAEGWEFVPKETMGRVALATGEEIQPGEHEHTWHFERAPARIELAWRPFRPELEVHSILDVTLAKSKARVQQEIQVQSSLTTPSAVRLKIPPALMGRVHVAKGGKLNPDSHEVTLTKLDDKSLILEYQFSFDDQDKQPRSIRVPIVQAAEATRTETKIRVWTEVGILPVADRELWEEMPVEIVAGRDFLPSLVVRSGREENSLQLRLIEVPSVRAASTIIPRASIQAAVDDGTQIYRARFLITQLHDPHLEVALPFPPAQINLRTLVNGRQIQFQPLVENRWQLDLEPFVSSKPFLLEIQYRIPTELLHERNSWQTEFWAPAFSDSVFVDRVRWQVTGPPGWVMLLPGLGQTWDFRWAWQDGLLAPRPALSRADLDRWVGDADPSESSLEPMADRAAELSLERGSLAALTVIHFWQPIWVLACSLVVVVICLAVLLGARSSPPPRLLFVGIGSIGLILLAAAVLWPGITPAIVSGAEPGMVVILILSSIQWLIQQRYRRRVIFLPSFTRLKAGSSVVRARAASPLREPTTVDAPAQPNEKPESSS